MVTRGSCGADHVCFKTRFSESQRLICSIDIALQSQGQLVYHVVHPNRISWKRVLAGISDAGVDFDTASSKKEWLSKVQSSILVNEEDTSSGMLPLWTRAVSLSMFMPFSMLIVSMDQTLIRMLNHRLLPTMLVTHRLPFLQSHRSRPRI